MDELSNKVAIVTGSTKGIGRSIAHLFSKNGAHVIVTSRSLDVAQNIVKELHPYGNEALAIKTDVGSDDDVSNLVDAVVSKYGKIDILINNAGFPLTAKYWDSSFDLLSIDDYQNVINVDLMGSIRCCKKIIPLMKRNKSGSIVNISSTPALSGHDLGAPYTIAKAGILGLTKHLAKEYGKYNIRVNCLALGNIKSSATFAHFDQDTQEKLSKESSLQRWGETIEVAKTCLMLSSDNFSFVNGQTIVVDGGNVLL